MDAITYEDNNKFNRDKLNESSDKINQALMLSEKEYIKSQQDVIDDFFKEYFTYDISNVGCWLVSGIFTFIQIVFSAFPVQQLLKEGVDGEFLGIMAFVIIFPVFFYLQAFITGQERYATGLGRVTSLYSAIKYLPVSIKTLRLYRFKRMVRHILKVFFICAVLQLGISLIAYHSITWQNLVFLGIYDFLIPFLVGCGQICFTK